MAIDIINQINPDFVLTGGDLIRDALNQTYGRSDSLYDLYIQVSGAYNMPVYNTICNHEIFEWNRDEDKILNHAEYGKKIYENRIEWLRMDLQKVDKETSITVSVHNFITG